VNTNPIVGFGKLEMIKEVALNDTIVQNTMQNSHIVVNVKRKNSDSAYFWDI
jgi:hypothetical protein